MMVPFPEQLAAFAFTVNLASPVVDPASCLNLSRCLKMSHNHRGRVQLSVQERDDDFCSRAPPRQIHSEDPLPEFRRPAASYS